MRTFLSFSGGGVSVRTRATFRCVDCGHHYHPRVHAHAGLVIVVAGMSIAAVLVVGVLWLRGHVDRRWLLRAKVAAALAVAVIGHLGFRLHQRLLSPKIYSPDSCRAPAYGEIVLECPRCGSDREV